MEKLHDNCSHCKHIPAPPELKCSKCGALSSETAYDFLVPIEVNINNGEEGEAVITQFLCDTCLAPMQEALMELGFKNHDHGSGCLLEDEDCEGGYSDCADPLKNSHLPYTVGNPELNKYNRVLCE